MIDLWFSSSNCSDLPQDLQSPSSPVDILLEGTVRSCGDDSVQNQIEDVGVFNEQQSLRGKKRQRANANVLSEMKMHLICLFFILFDASELLHRHSRSIVVKAVNEFREDDV